MPTPIWVARYVTDPLVLEGCDPGWHTVEVHSNGQEIVSERDAFPTQEAAEEEARRMNEWQD